MVSIFEYTDFREYLKVCFAQRKAEDRRFSHRWLAQRLGLSTSNFIMLVMQGKRNLNQTFCLGLSDVFKHSKKEADYFLEMVNFGQAKTSREKEIFFEKLTAKRKDCRVATIDEGMYEYYSHWYNPVIRELAVDPQFDGSALWLCKKLVPAITEKQAQKSLDLLVKLGMLIKVGNRYTQQEPLLTTAPEVTSLSIRKFHRNMGTLAIESLDTISKSERSITSSTIKISKQSYNKLCQRIDEFRNEILEFACNEEDGDRVYQLNFQVFPVTKSLRGKDSSQ